MKNNAVGQGFSPAGTCRKPKGLPYAGDSNVGQGFSLADTGRKPEGLPYDDNSLAGARRKSESLPYARPNVGQGFSPAGTCRKPEGLPYDGSGVGRGFSLTNMKFKKRIRLKEFSYKGTHRYFVTLCTYNKANIFRDDFLASCLLDSLREKSESFRFRVWAYCFMPDHLHVLVEGSDDSSDFRKFISSFKQDSGFTYKKKSGLRLWQTNCYEHVLRKEEDTNAVANYIFNNPVRKGYVENYRQYALLGSFEFDVSQTQRSALR